MAVLMHCLDVYSSVCSQLGRCLLSVQWNSQEQELNRDVTVFIKLNLGFLPVNSF